MNALQKQAAVLVEADSPRQLEREVQTVLDDLDVGVTVTSCSYSYSPFVGGVSALLILTRA